MMEGIDTVRAMLAIMTHAVPRLGVDDDRCAAGVSGDLLATDEVYRRVRNGVPFRSAYRQVAAEITDGAEMPQLDPEAILEARMNLGGAGAPPLGKLGEILALEEQRVKGLGDTFSRALTQLEGSDPL